MFEDRLRESNGQSQTAAKLGFLQVYANQRLLMFQRVIDFVTAVSGLDRIGSDKVEKVACPFDSLS